MKNVIITSFIGRIQCSSKQHNRKKAATCTKGCTKICLQCRSNSKYLLYQYKCHQCNLTFCIIHFQTYITHSKYKSTILNCHYIAQINHWIGKTYKYSLLFRASKDGYGSQEFHDRCDGKSPTVTIVRTSKQKVIGGFTSLKWDSFDHTVEDNTKTSFMFSMDMDRKYSLVQGAQCAIICYSYYGPAFGNWGFCICQVDTDDCRKPCSCASDEHLIRGDEYEAETYLNFLGETEGRFSVIDYEVFLLS